MVGLEVITLVFWGRALGVAALDLCSKGDGVDGGEPPVDGQDTKVAHWVMAAIQSVRTLLWISLADWGDTGSSPLPSVVTLGSITVMEGGGVGGRGTGERFSISMSLRTLTRLLMVSRIFSIL
jgi:hypothetical protein